MGNIIKIKTGSSAPTNGSLQTGELGYCINSGQENGLYIGVNSTVEKVSSPPEISISSAQPSGDETLWIDLSNGADDPINFTVDGIGKNSNNNIPLGAVTYNSSLILSDSQKEIARNNIGALPVETTASDIGASNIIHATTHSSLGSDPISPDSIGAPSKSSISTETLLPAGWVGDVAPYSYILTLNGVMSNSVIEVIPGLNITIDQIKSLQKANFQDGGQTENQFTILAYGSKPIINIPIRIIIRRDL